MPRFDCDFFEEVPRYRGNLAALSRLRARWKRVVEPVIPILQGKSVLDLGAHDGRWSYAYSYAGAGQVTAIEARLELLKQFREYPDIDVSSRVSLVHEDLFLYLECAVDQGKSFDVVAVLGILYHTIDHYRLFLLIKKLDPKVIVIDSEFINTPNAMIQIVTESTENILNAAPQYNGQKRTLVGIPSDGTIEKIAEILNFKVVWYNGYEDETRIKDYTRKNRKRRRTCYLINLGSEFCPAE